MADRWLPDATADPESGRYVWLPIARHSGGLLSVPWRSSWQPSELGTLLLPPQPPPPPLLPPPPLPPEPPPTPPRYPPGYRVPYAELIAGRRDLLTIASTVQLPGGITRVWCYMLDNSHPEVHAALGGCEGYYVSSPSRPGGVTLCTKDDSTGRCLGAWGSW